MDDFKELYHKLFNKITDVINELKAAQQEEEEMFLSQNNEAQNADDTIKSD